MPRLKICLCGETRSIHTLRYIRFFIDRGHEVHAIAVCPPEPTLMAGVLSHRIRRLGPPARGIGKFVHFLHLALQCVRRIRAIKPDLVNVMFLTDFGLFAALSGMHPLVIVPWGSDVLRHPRQKRFWKMAGRFALRHSELVLCNSQVMRRELVNSLGLAEGRIRDVVWNGVDLDLFSPGDAAELRSDPALKGKTVILSNRNLRPIYRIDRVLEMFARLRNQVADPVLLVAGDGPERRRLERQCGELGISTQVTFLGQVSQQALRGYLRQADLYISVSESDSSATSVLEAMACGSTIVASDIPANREWIQHGQNGWLADPSDLDSFTNICLTALRRAVAPQALESNRRRIAAEADFEANMRAIEALFQKMAARGRAAS